MSTRPNLCRFHEWRFPGDEPGVIQLRATSTS
jgi:hypothetical protein